MIILLEVIGVYFIADILLVVYSRLYYDYWWLLYYKLLFIILCYITTIGDYFIISYCWIL
jgi:hypothetical protein